MVGAEPEPLDVDVDADADSGGRSSPVMWMWRALRTDITRMKSAGMGPLVTYGGSGRKANWAACAVMLTTGGVRPVI